MGTLSPPYPWNLSLSRQNDGRGRLAPPRHSGSWVGAPVAFLRSRTLRPGAVSITALCWLEKKRLQKLASPRYNYPCPGSAPLAGFEVSTYGRFSDVHRGRVRWGNNQGEKQISTGIETRQRSEEQGTRRKEAMSMLLERWNRLFCVFVSESAGRRLCLVSSRRKDHKNNESYKFLQDFGKFRRTIDAN